MKKIFFLFCILSINTQIQCMKHAHNNTATTDLIALETLPEDIHLYLFPLIAPVSNWQKNSLNLHAIAKTTITLQQTCKSFASSFSTEKIIHLINITDLNKNHLLMNAAIAGIPKLVKHAINNKADINYFDTQNKCTPLSAATRENNYKCCLYLLTAGANVNEPNAASKPSAYRPIEIAARNCFFKITQLLIEFNAELNEECRCCTGGPLSHMFGGWRSNIQNAQIVKLLIDNGAKTEEFDQNKITQMLAFITNV